MISPQPSNIERRSVGAARLQVRIILGEDFSTTWLCKERLGYRLSSD